MQNSIFGYDISIKHTIIIKKTITAPTNSQFFSYSLLMVIITISKLKNQPL